MLCKSFKIIDSQSSASDTIPLCFSTASKIKNIKCPAVNQKWWDRLMNIYSKKTPRPLNINVHHRPASKNWTHDYWKRIGYNICLVVDPDISLCIKSKICFDHPSRKSPRCVFDFILQYNWISRMLFFLNSISYFSHMISQYFKFWKFLFFFKFFKFLLFLLKKGDL